MKRRSRSLYSEQGTGMTVLPASASGTAHPTTKPGGTGRQIAAIATGIAIAETKSWSSWASKCGPGIFDAIEADLFKAEKQVDLEVRTDELTVKLRAIWRRARPNGWVSEQRRHGYDWKVLLAQRAIDKLKAAEVQAAMEAAAEEAARRAAQAAEIASKMAAKLVENALAEAALTAAEEERLAAEEAADRAAKEAAERAAIMAALESEEKARLVEDRQRQAVENAKLAAERWEAERLKAVQLEAVRAAREEADAGIRAGKKWQAELLVEETRARRRAALDLLQQMKRQSSWLSGQAVSQFSPNSLPWQTFRPKRGELDRKQNHRASAEAAVVGSFVDALAVRPKTPVRVTIAPDASNFGTGTSTSGLSISSPFLSAATFRPTRSEEALTTVHRSGRSKPHRGLSSAHISTQLELTDKPVKGAVPFRSPGVLAPAQQYLPQMSAQSEQSESMTYLAEAMSGGPSQLLPVVEINDLKEVLNTAGIGSPNNEAGERKAQKLFTELAALEAALFSRSNLSGERVHPDREWDIAANSFCGNWGVFRPRTQGVGVAPSASTSLEDNSAESELCPHLVLKRKVLTVHLVSADGRLELLQWVSDQSVYRRIRARLTDRSSPARVAVALVRKLFGVEVTQIRELDTHPLVVQRPPERCYYPCLRCEETHFVVRLHVEGLVRHSFRNHTGDWGWIRRDQDEKIRSKVAMRPSTSSISLPSMPSVPGVENEPKGALASVGFEQSLFVVPSSSIRDHPVLSRPRKLDRRPVTSGNKQWPNTSQNPQRPNSSRNVPLDVLNLGLALGVIT